MFGQSVTFTAIMSMTAPGAGTPTGTVDFFDESTKLSSGTLATSNGVTATYKGDGNFVGITSAVLTQNVDTSPSGYPKLSSGAYNLLNATLPGAYLAQANVAKTNLSGANLSSANLSQATLKGATGLTTATLTGSI